MMPATRILTCVVFPILLCSPASLPAYDEPGTANVGFDPAGIVLDSATSDRLPVLLIGLATDYPDRSDRQRAAALAVVMKLHPDSAAAHSTNRALAMGQTPDPMEVGIPPREALAELWEIAAAIRAEALTRDEQMLATYLAAVVLIFSDKGDDPRFARARTLVSEMDSDLWKGVLPPP